MIKKIIKKVFRRIKRIINKPPEPIDWEEKKMKDDYDYLISQGVETEYGSVKLGGKPIIQKYHNSRIIIGRNVTLLSDSDCNVAGINHPVILATCGEGAVIELKEGCGLSGTSVVALKSVVIGENAMFGVNTNVYDLKYNFSDSIIEFNSIEKYLNIYRKKIYKKREYNKDKVLTLNQKANLDPMDFDKACKIVRSFGYKIFKEI